METYIGTKVVQAEPQSRLDSVSGLSEEGYKVVYEDGYVSWSPAAVFERCYRRVTTAEKELIL